MEKYENKEKLYRKSKVSKEVFNKLWLDVSHSRRTKGIELELIDKWERKLFFNLTDSMKKKLEKINLSTIKLLDIVRKRGI